MEKLTDVWYTSNTLVLIYPFMLSNSLGWIILIIPALVVVSIFFWCVQAKTKHRKDCDTSIGKQKELNNLLFQAVAEGSLSKAKEAIAAGADVSVRGLAGKTPLIRIAHRAADPKHHNNEVNIAIAKLLVENGADVNISDLFNSSAIEYCDWDLPWSSPQMAEFLQKNGAKKFPHASSREQSGL